MDLTLVLTELTNMSLIAFALSIILAAIQIIKYTNDKEKLEIKILKSKFNQAKDQAMNYLPAEIYVKAEIKNKGRQPTTISSITFDSKPLDLKEIKFTNTITYPGNKYAPIPMKKHEIKQIDLSAYPGNDLTNIDEIEGTITFETTHDKIKQDIKIKKINY